jgi:hypothetical protein
MLMQLFHRVGLSLLIVCLVLISPHALASSGEIAELKEQIRQLMHRVEELERKELANKATARKVDKIAVKNVSSGNSSSSLAVSGWMNRGLLLLDDGVDNNSYFVDGILPSRFRLKAKANGSNGWQIGSNMEWHYRSNSSYLIDQYDQDSGTTDGALKERVLEIYFQNPSLGKLSLGQGATASNGISERDLSGTFVAGYSDSRFLAGGMRFSQSSGLLTDSDVSNPRVRHTLSNMDGLSLRDRIRYDTPYFSGFKLSIGASQGDAYDASLAYAADFGAYKLAAALGGSTAAINYLGGSSKDFTQYAGSASILFDKGLNFTIAGGLQDTDIANREDPTFIYSKLGYQAQLWQTGKSNVSVDYHATNDLSQDGDEGRSFGLQAVQNLDEWGTELYFSLRQYQYDQTGVEYDDIIGTLVGARVKF